MIEYQYDEEQKVFLCFADFLCDERAKKLIIKGVIANSEDATYIRKFFWHVVNETSKSDKIIQLPCEGSPQFWTEKLYNSLGGYLENSGYEKEWDTEIDNN